MLPDLANMGKRAGMAHGPNANLLITELLPDDQKLSKNDYAG